MILLVLCVLLSWNSEDLKEFCAGEWLDQFFFQHFAFFKNLELIIKEKKKIPAVVYGSFSESLLTFTSCFFELAYYAFTVEERIGCSVILQSSCGSNSFLHIINPHSVWMNSS